MRLLATPIERDNDVVAVRQHAKRIAEILGYAAQEQTRLATAVSEVARHLLSGGSKGRAEFLLKDEPRGELLIAQIYAEEPAGELFADNHDAVIAARRLVDHYRVQRQDAAEVLIELGKRSTRRSQVPRREIHRQIEASVRRSAVEPSAALRDYDRELIASLEDIQGKQQELQRLNKELEETNRGVVALYAELEEKAEQLRAASESKSRFLTNVSHEFRTPLNSILALSRLLLDRVDGDLHPEQERQVVYIRRSAETLLEFVNDLLDLAKVEAGKIDVHLSRFAVKDLFGGLKGVLKPLQRSDEVLLVFEEPMPVLLNSDEGKLAQILRNLISNALKYTERGEVRVSAAVNASKGTVTFRVADTGIGIAREDQARIFEEFEQVAGSFQQKNPGSGLGLALSRKLARLLRGDITVHSVLGQGSTFELCVPIDHQHPLGTGVEMAERACGARRVLVVDDEDTFRYVVRHIIESESGFDLIEAADGAEGMMRAHQDRPDVIVLDLQMPTMSGFEMLEELARTPDTRDIPVIVSTSSAITPKLEQELAAAFRLLSKSSLSKEVLLSTIEGALASRRAH